MLTPLVNLDVPDNMPWRRRFAKRHFPGLL
jgi:hypothetical protein